LSEAVSFKTVTENRLKEFQQSMRDNDRQELMLMSLYSNVEAELPRLINISDWAAIGYIFDEMAALIAVIPVNMIEDRYAILFLTTPVVDKNPVIFLRRTKQSFAKLAETYSTLETYVDLSYNEAVKWLEWLGADFGEIYGDDNQFQHVGINI